jgi:hypothetical protein
MYTHATNAFTQSIDAMNQNLSGTVRLKAKSSAPPRQALEKQEKERALRIFGAPFLFRRGCAN